MKKTIAFLPAPVLTLSLFASAAESVPMNREERRQYPAKNFRTGEPLRCMEEYGGGLKAVMAGGEAYRTVADCRAAVSVQ